MRVADCICILPHASREQSEFKNEHHGIKGKHVSILLTSGKAHQIQWKNPSNYVSVGGLKISSFFWKVESRKNIQYFSVIANVSRMLICDHLIIYQMIQEKS